MSQPRVKSQIRVQAWLRRCATAGLMAAVARKGEEESGAIIIKVNRFAAGCDVFVEVAGDGGEPVWMRALGDASVREADADAYIARQVRIDADLWVLEIEDPRGVFVMTEPLMAAQKNRRSGRMDGVTTPR
jgi:GMP synthase (glutamine-hydrolysing)